MGDGHSLDSRNFPWDTPESWDLDVFQSPVADGQFVPGDGRSVGNWVLSGSLETIFIIQRTLLRDCNTQNTFCVRKRKVVKGSTRVLMTVKK